MRARKITFEKQAGSLRLTKEDIALRELRTAVTLYLQHEDVISAHVLMNAAHEIIQPVAKRRNLKSFVEQLDEIVPAERREEARERLKHHYNFFKHGSRDPDAAEEGFHPTMTEVVLVHVIRDFRNVFRRRFVEGAIFVAWAGARTGEYLDPAAMSTARSMFPGIEHMTLPEAAKVGFDYLEMVKADPESLAHFEGDLADDWELPPGILKGR